MTLDPQQPEVRPTAREYAGLARELPAVSYRRAPGLTIAVLLTQALSLVTVAATALTLRAAINGAIAHDTGAAVAGAAGAAVVYAATAALGDLGFNVKGRLVDKVAVLDLPASINRDIARLDGLEHVERSDFLDRVNIVLSAPWAIVNGFWSAVAALFGVLQLGISLLLLGTVSPWLLLLVLFAAAPLWFDRQGQRRVSRAETDTAEAVRLQKHLFDTASEEAAAKEIRVAGAAGELVRRQAAVWEAVATHRFRAEMRAAAWRVSGWSLFTVGFVAALAVVIHRTADGHGSPGDIVLAITVASTLRGSVEAAVGRTTDSVAAQRFVEPYLWLRRFVAERRTHGSGGLATPPRLTEGIAFERVSYRYPGTDRFALEDVSFTIPAGTVVAIVGEYGSGKTTLVKLLNRFYRPDSGRITVDGVDLALHDGEGWHARTSAAFQDFGRYRTVFSETVGLGDLPHVDDRGRIAEALREAEATGFVSRLPQGVDTRLGRALGGVELSEGQWQKTALARATMRREPLLFVLDEPTASLDAPSEQEIFQRQMARARELAERTGAITVIVSHRFSTVTGADLILVLDRGRLEEVGSHRELLALGGRYAELYGIQATAYAGS
ncbi:ABC transporter ATP-binding protein [Streptomyces sp. NRRL WC-3742]|uniref:ABC transporter ATP-binding protein n=1 Tax=Streptomyces sp. NRRL WC-3742 TaxID=1463934 RepID=UPI000ADF4EED|nr:ABC transporter ATP-binding protein [Streptomyces sp. NRRL WC-3742]